MFTAFFHIANTTSNCSTSCECICHSRFVEERSYKRFAEACLEETIVIYVDRLLIQVCISQHGPALVLISPRFVVISRLLVLTTKFRQYIGTTIESAVARVSN